MSDVAGNPRFLRAEEGLEGRDPVWGGRRRITAGALRLACAAVDAAQVAVAGAAVLSAAEGAPLSLPPGTIGTVVVAAVIAALAREACARRASATGRSVRDEAAAGAASVLIAVAVIVACLSFAAHPPYEVPGWHLAWGAVSALISAALWSAVGRAGARGGLGARRVAVVGAVAEAAHAAGAIAADRERLGWTVVLDVRDSEPRQMGGLRDLAVDGHIDVVVLAMPPGEGTRIRATGAALVDVPVHLCLAIQTLTLRPPGHDAESPAFVDIARHPHSGAGGALKRVLDVVLSSLAIVAFAPVLGCVALAVRLDSPGPALFRQWRFGVGSRPIQILKFRTMRADLCDATGETRTAARDPRVTRVGRILRRTSLDELPQLFNVLVGDMSLVGPRPHAMFMKVGGGFYSDVVDGYRARHRVRPGITGWAQVNGLRGEVDSPEKARKRVQHDMWYIENWSFSLDLVILVRTFCGGFATFSAD